MNNRKKLLYFLVVQIIWEFKKKSNKIKFNTPQCTNLMSKKRWTHISSYESRISPVIINLNIDIHSILEHSQFRQYQCEWVRSLLLNIFQKKRKKKHWTENHLHTTKWNETFNVQITTCVRLFMCECVFIRKLLSSRVEFYILC